MTKDELVNALAEKAGVSKADAGRVLNAFVDVSTAALSKGDSIALSGFGTFQISRRAARQGRNPQTGEALQIPAMNVPRFKASKTLKDAVR